MDQSRSSEPARRWIGALAALAAGVCLQITRPAYAADPSAYLSEILTPAGWELHASRCVLVDEPPTSAELRIPDGWDSMSRSRDEPRWGSAFCSELVVPLEWTRAEDRPRSLRAQSTPFQNHSNIL